jgi:hypothetical protein
MASSGKTTRAIVHRVTCHTLMGRYTRRKPCPIQPDKERLYVLCNSKMTTEAIYCINIDVHWLVVVFQSLGRLRDVFAQK